VGIPLAVEFAKGGLDVIGLDVVEDRVRDINSGRSPVLDVSDAAIAELVASKRLRATTDFDALSDVDAACICVPTPLRKSQDPDISYIVAAVEEIAKRIHPGLLVVLESTTYPGTTDELVLPRLADGGLRVGEDFYLAFSPERVDPGNTRYTTRNTPKVIGGVTPRCTERAVELYRHAVNEIVPVSGARVAEMVKLLENTFRAINIGMVNELAIMCDRLDVDVWEVINAAKTKPFGFMPFYPGPGLGGHCIPIDPQYLSWKLRTVNYTARFIELATAINSSMPLYVAGKVADALNEKQKSVRGSRILVLGVAYKKDVGDIRESPALDVMGLLKKKGALLSYTDPYVPSLDFLGEPLQSYDIEQGVARFDCVLIVTDHSAFNYETILEQAPLVFDTRNATAGYPAPSTCTVVRL
jgi:UDP-N-acetyl-D-glucosamine dehydrogenase